jgi:isoleucyl-tRNA synthetase
VVIDTQLSPALLAEGDARELQRAIQDLRREAELDLDARIAVWVEPLPADLGPFLDAVRADTLADRIEAGPAPADLPRSRVELASGSVELALRPTAGGR